MEDKSMSTLIEDYKYLHQIPEEGFKEFKTHEYIKKELPTAGEVADLIKKGI